MRMEWTALALFVVNVLVFLLRGRIAPRPADDESRVGPVVQRWVDESEPPPAP